MNKTLMEMLPPPEKPEEAVTTNQWHSIEGQVCPMPSDFKEFLSLYGTGQVDNFMWILNPISSHKYLNLIEQIDIIRDAYKIREVDFGEKAILLFPERGGLLPIAITDNGDTIFYRCSSDDPVSWSIVITSARDPDRDEFNMNFTTWLERTLSRTIKNQCFPDSFPSKIHSFKSFAENR